MAENQYQGDERKQAFVERRHDRLWSWCCSKHREAWGGKRRVPSGVLHEGKSGWWFPEAWVVDFRDRFGETQRGPRPAPQLERRARQVADAQRLTFNRFPTTTEMLSWGLPIGTQLNSNRIAYPDGSSETIEDIRLRLGSSRHHAASPEQQNLERMLEMLHTKADVQPSDELVHSLTKDAAE